MRLKKTVIGGNLYARALSIIALVLTGAAFILLCLIWVLRINAIIPVLMFAAAIILLGICKKMPVKPQTGIDKSQISNDAFLMKTASRCVHPAVVRRTANDAQ